MGSRNIGLLAVAAGIAFLVALALGVPAASIASFGVFLICPLMMIFMMRGMHGSHGSGHGGGGHSCCAGDSSSTPQGSQTSRPHDQATPH
ncbi:MAG: DUF2933 domain-containing protein [Candidatus Nanopelagicales bacterium]|nr:DUF2933 domain-containing protein [Candidatus Nanopelagicales bacterium]